MRYLIDLVAAFLAVGMPGMALAGEPAVGDRYLLKIEHSSQSASADGKSSSSSSGTDVIVERIVAVSDKGLTLEYSEPESDNERLRDWHFPALIFRGRDGTRTLLNADEVEARLQPWLEAAEFPPEACGQWIFTWNAFQIDCDPQSAVAITESFDMWAFGLGPGFSWAEKGTIEPVGLQPDDDAPGLSATLAIDPEAVRKEAAESDVVVGKIMGEPVTPVEATSNHAHDQITGTLDLIVDSADPPKIDRIERRASITVTRPGEASETRKTNSVSTRTRLSAAD